MSQLNDEMSFWDHLEALRWTLFRCILALFVFTIASFSVMRYLFDHKNFVLSASLIFSFATILKKRFTGHLKREERRTF